MAARMGPRHPDLDRWRGRLAAGYADVALDDLRL